MPSLRSACLGGLLALCAFVKAENGDATYYDASVGIGACGYPINNRPGGVHGVAILEASWGSPLCGRCVHATSDNGNSVTAMIVDMCPECAHGDLDLYTDAFAALDNLDRGRMPITWEYVACP